MAKEGGMTAGIMKAILDEHPEDADAEMVIAIGANIYEIAAVNKVGHTEDCDCGGEGFSILLTCYPHPGDN